MDCSNNCRGYETLKSHVRTLLRELQLRNKLLLKYHAIMANKNKKKIKKRSNFIQNKSEINEYHVKQYDDPTKVETYGISELHNINKSVNCNFKSEEKFSLTDPQLLNSLEERHNLMWQSITNIQEKLKAIELDTTDDCESTTKINEKLSHMYWKCENIKSNIAKKYQEIRFMQSHHSHLNICNHTDAEYNKLEVYADRIAAMKNLCTRYKESIKEVEKSYVGMKISKDDFIGRIQKFCMTT